MSALKANTQELTNSDEKDWDTVCREESSQREHISPARLNQIGKMFQKALKHTSKHITNNLTKEVREVGHRLSELETRVDDMKNYTLNYTVEIENLKDET